ncbi:MAG TPA: tripartite tricarboxylate transporter substrate-binding protein [Candidatus Acidoferrales bacterium]|nr:tripartite tricarboxylate transporter substrate-binding protein [Candidatus Acidoferrales bacterium]
MRALVVPIIFSIFLCWPSHAQSQSYYQGKTITIISGTTAGSQYDAYARLIAAHFGKHVPGKPNVLVQNMPGGGSMVAANYVYGVAKPDGLAIGSINPALYFNQLAQRKEVQFDWAKFQWLGSPDRSDHLLYMRTDTPYKTIHDVRKATTPPKCTATATGTTGHYLPKLLEETIGTKFEIILGYPGGPEMDLAVERNEAQCRAFTVTAWFSGEPYATWRKNNFARVLIQTGRTQRDERLPDVPTLYELMDQYKTPENDRRLADVVLASNIFGRPYVVAPGVPADQVKILREAFAKTMVDPEFLAEAKKRNLEIRPSAGEELEKLAKTIVVQPPEVVERMKKLLGK